MVKLNGLSKSGKPTPSKSTGNKGTPPPESQIKHNLKTPKITTPNVGLQLKIHPDLRKEFKILATQENLNLNELFTRVYDFYKEHHQ